jgi:hypothetical protein
MTGGASLSDGIGEDGDPVLQAEVQGGVTRSPRPTWKSPSLVCGADTHTIVTNTYDDTCDAHRRRLIGGTSGEICYCMVPQWDSMCDRAHAHAPPCVRVVRPAAGRFSNADHVSRRGSLVA